MEDREDIKNINTLAADVQQDFNEFVRLSLKMDIHKSGEYRDGFREGVNALQMRFLKEFDTLNYVHKKRG